MPATIVSERVKDRVRQQRRRDRLSESRTPTTHTLNRALVEAMMQCIEINRQQGGNRMLTPVTLIDLLPRAIAILTLGENAASNYDLERVKEVARKRVKKRPEQWDIDRVSARMTRDVITPKT